MKYVIRRDEAETTQENGVSRFHDYPFPFQNASLGVSEIDGRYPEKGFDVDETVEQSWYVESGHATIWVGGETYELNHGDMAYLPAGEKYWIDGKNLRLIVCSGKPWFPEQHKHVPEG